LETPEDEKDHFCSDFCKIKSRRLQNKINKRKKQCVAAKRLTLYVSTIPQEDFNELIRKIELSTYYHNPSISERGPRRERKRIDYELSCYICEFGSTSDESIRFANS
jgi:hypothetical protein